MIEGSGGRKGGATRAAPFGLGLLHASPSGGEDETGQQPGKGKWGGGGRGKGGGGGGGGRGGGAGRRYRAIAQLEEGSKLVVTLHIRRGPF